MECATTAILSPSTSVRCHRTRRQLRFVVYGVLVLSNYLLYCFFFPWSGIKKGTINSRLQKVLHYDCIIVILISKHIHTCLGRCDVRDNMLLYIFSRSLLKIKEHKTCYYHFMNNGVYCLNYITGVGFLLI